WRGVGQPRDSFGRVLRLHFPRLPLTRVATDGTPSSSWKTAPGTGIERRTLDGSEDLPPQSSPSPVLPFMDGATTAPVVGHRSPKKFRRARFSAVSICSHVRGMGGWPAVGWCDLPLAAGRRGEGRHRCCCLIHAKS